MLVLIGNPVLIRDYVDYGVCFDLGVLVLIRNPVLIRDYVD